MKSSGGVARTSLYFTVLILITLLFIGAGLAREVSGEEAATEGAQAPELRSENTKPDVISSETLKGGERVKVRYDHDTGAPAFITGDIASPAGAGPFEKSIAFFNANKEIYRMTNPHAEMSLKRQDVDSLGMTHVHMGQKFKDIPVFGADMAVHYSKEGRIVAVSGHYVPDIDIDVKPDVTVDDAVRAALEDLGQAADSPSSEPPQLMVLAQAGKPAQLTWKVALTNDEQPLLMFYFIDANSGEAVARYDGIETLKYREMYTAQNQHMLPGVWLFSEGGSSGDWKANVT